MRKMLLLVALATLVLLSLSTVGSANDELADGRAMIQAERQDMVRSELHMTGKEAEEFWPVYSAYREKYDGVMRRYGQMIAEYLRRYDDADGRVVTGSAGVFAGIPGGIASIESRPVLSTRKQVQCRD